MPVLTENPHAGCYIVSEQHGFYSRDTIQMSNALAAVPGTVLSKSALVAALLVSGVAAAAGNTGNGTLTPDATAPVTAAAVDGPYVVEFTAPTSYNVLDPSGKIVGKGTVAAGYSGPIKFAVAAGGTAFVAGDSFTVTVLRPDGVGDQYAPLDTGFTGIVGGILFGYVPAFPAGGAAGLVPAVAHVRSSEVRASDLVWPAGASAAQIAEGTVQLKRLGIVLR